MEQFTPEQKRYVVQRLACYASPKIVAKEVKDLFDLDELPSIARVMYYDPTTAQSEHLDDELRKLFDATRRKYLKRTQNIPIATQSGRLTRLQEIIDNTENTVLQAKLIEQAAKEMGGLFVRPLVTPKTDEKDGGDGKPSILNYNVTLSPPQTVDADTAASDED